MTDKKQLICPVCGAKRDTVQQMKVHINSKHPITKKENDK